MTDAELFARLLYLRDKASRARPGREFTASEYPEVIAGISACERIILELTEALIAKEPTDALDAVSGHAVEFRSRRAKSE